MVRGAVNRILTAYTLLAGRHVRLAIVAFWLPGGLSVVDGDNIRRVRGD